MSRQPEHEDDFSPGVAETNAADLGDVNSDDAKNDDSKSPSFADELTLVRAERDALFERFARAQADFQNSRKRLEADGEQRLQYANSTLLKSLLPVIDNLERAMAVDVKKIDTAALMKGLNAVVDQFTKVLATQHLEIIAPEPGTAFDPTKHEALLQQASEEYPPNTVTQLLQKGYVLRDRTLRPAQVAVSK